ncbi:MAG: NADP oxidoreductase, partial [Actinobacteria bacterium]|nr:NADP oxidoreductase [Actinomycetota bacterium]
MISLGIVGTGRLGGVLARLARDAGLEVRTVSSSDSPAALADAASSDVVVLALPLRRLR